MKRSLGQLVALLLVLPVTSVSAQFVGTKPSQEAMTLDIDSTVTKRLASIEDFIAEKQWDTVATLLRQTQAEKPDKLVAIAPGWYVGVARFCQCQAASMPPPALAAYRRLMDATAKKWFDDTERLFASDPARQRIAWLRIVRQAFASSSGDEALNRLAEQSFEQADYATARTYWEMQLPAAGSLRAAAGLGLLRHPEPSGDAALIRAQLILCSLFEKDVARAGHELAVFRRLHGNSVGRIAGRDGMLAELLSQMQDRSPAAESPKDSTPDFDRRLWSVQLPSQLARGDRDIVPLIIGGTLFATNGEAVFAFDAATGRPKWSEPDDSPLDAHAAVIHSLADPVVPKLPIDGRPRNSLSVFGDRLYARLGTSITARAKQETNSHSELVGLDISVGEGKLVWRVAAEEIDPQDPLSATSLWNFDGAPVADLQRVYVILRRSLPQEQLNVACFDAETARLLWNRKIGITVAATEETVNSTSHLQVTLAEDSVFVSTDAGAIAALDAHDGAIRWLRTYASDAVLTSRGSRRDGHAPPVYHDGTLYVAPLDSDLLLAIHAESGLLLWQREWPDPLQSVLGVAGNTLIVQGRSLWGVELATGEPAWPSRRVGSDDPEGFSFGQGALIGGEVWWPNRDDLLVVAARSGQITRRITIRESLRLTGGDLTACGRSLVISRGSQLTVLESKR